MVEATPGGPGRLEPPFRGVQWTVTHLAGTVARRTVQRRVDAWLAGDRSSYAIRGTSSARGDRLVDPVDAERVRLQHTGRLGPEVTTEQWRQMIQERDIPWMYVTGEDWFRQFVGPNPQE